MNRFSTKPHLDEKPQALATEQISAGHEVPGVVVWSLPIVLLKCSETLAVKATLQSEVQCDMWPRPARLHVFK